ncbi:MAG: GH3 auxin-responsive promoter family protein [Bacteroidales bacterium]|nr:GH3 auxin-responsive promoter family protein [Bacteroidales bacterium]
MNLTKAIFSCFSHRLSEIESSYARPVETQQQQLRYLLNKAKNTEWGKTHNFAEIKNHDDFSKQLPTQDYEDVKLIIKRMLDGESNLIWPSKIEWFAKSSGTTNDKSKFLPVSTESLQNCHYRGAKDCLAFYSKINPESHLFGGKSLILGGSHKISNLINNTFVGDLSAILIQNNPFYTNWIRTPHRSVALMDEWEAKLEKIVETTFKQDVRSLSGVPSWMLVMIKRVLEKTGKSNLNEVWPNLELFFHGGVSFRPYREQYQELIPSPNMHYVENYNASEGFFATQNDIEDSAMLLMIDYGIFYEFIPFNEYAVENPKVLPLWEVETGKNYAVVITTNSGLWRYKLGDTVMFTSTKPYKIKITGRTKHHINAFGEELMIDNAEKGLLRACAQTGAKVKEYTAAPVFMSSKTKGNHEWLIEFEKLPTSMEEFCQILDKTLQEINSDYEAKRYKDMTLKKLEIVVARKNLFHDWLKSKGKLGGQHKIPRLSNSREYLDELLTLNV